MEWVGISPVFKQSELRIKKKKKKKITSQSKAQI